MFNCAFRIADSSLRGRLLTSSFSSVSSTFTKVQGGSLVGLYDPKQNISAKGDPYKLKRISAGTVTIVHKPEYGRHKGKPILVTCQHVIGHFEAEKKTYVWGNEGVIVGNSIKPLFVPVQLELLDENYDNDTAVLTYQQQNEQLFMLDHIQTKYATSVNVKIIPDENFTPSMYGDSLVKYFGANSGYLEANYFGDVSYTSHLIRTAYDELREPTKIIQNREDLLLFSTPEHTQFTKGGDSGSPLYDDFMHLIGIHHGMVCYKPVLGSDKNVYFSYASSFRQIQDILGYSPSSRESVPFGVFGVSNDSEYTVSKQKRQCQMVYGLLADELLDAGINFKRVSMSQEMLSQYFEYDSPPLCFPIYNKGFFNEGNVTFRTGPGTFYGVDKTDLTEKDDSKIVPLDKIPQNSSEEKPEK